MAVKTDEFAITQSDSNITLAAGTADKETTIATYTVPDRTKTEILPGKIFSLYLADTTPTQLAGTSLVKLTLEDPNGIVTSLLTQRDYTVLQEFQDKTKVFTFAQRVVAQPKDRIRIKVTGNLAAATAQTRFQIECRRHTLL